MTATVDAPARSRPTRRISADVYTLRPTTREERGCWCPFPPGCSGSPCVAGPRGHLRALLRARYEWATAPDTAVMGAERRTAELARLATEIAAVRAQLRAARCGGTNGWVVTVACPTGLRRITVGPEWMFDGRTPAEIALGLVEWRTGVARRYWKAVAVHETP